ncbi:unnamed protein product [Urochloa decumbens]|uniref:Uncharacterized protein n=1 Tax=Urochloa decumbens TaxID=240449 RepID=A0ABC9E9M1_9POAL
MRKLVMMSYNHLPSHLKPCFLYLSIFPEDFDIRKQRLVDRWIAEGFVRARTGMTIQDIGEKNFQELLSRSMIQPSRVNIEGCVKSCRVHDIIWDIMVSIWREEYFVYSAPDNVPGVVEENIRHIVCHGSNHQALGVMDWTRVRSLTFFGDRYMVSAPSVCSPQLRMLRALDLENAEYAFTQKEINNIGFLHHLKYLNVQYGQGYSNLYALPRSIGKLQGLQALNIRASYISTLPTEISQLQNLRSLRCSRTGFCGNFDKDKPMECLMEILCMPLIFTPLFDSEERYETTAKLHMACCCRWSKSHGVRVPTGICKLKELQILEVVDIRRTNTKAIEELGELCQLRKLNAITKGATDKNCRTFCKAIQKLSFLRSLSIVSTDDSSPGTLEWLGSALSLPPLLRTLKLIGCIGEMPDFFRNLKQLVKIFLCGSELKEGKTMEILGVLPNLMLLYLYPSSYVGKALVFRGGAFPCLRKLYTSGLNQLKEMRFEEGASPEMESVEIGYCRLESGIIGIKHLPRLKEISLRCESKVARLGALQEEVNAHRNQPVLRLQKHQSDHNLGEVEGSDVQVQGTESVPDHAQEESQQIKPTTAMCLMPAFIITAPNLC